MPKSIAKAEVAPAMKCLALAAAAMAFAMPSQGALPPGTSEVVLELTGSGQTIFGGTGPLKQSLSDGYTTMAGSSWGGAVIGETGEESGRRFAMASASSVSLAANNAGAFGNATASARLDYRLLLYQLAPPPIPLAFVPGRVHVRAWASASALGDPLNNVAYANAAVTISNALPVFVEALGSEGSARQDADQSLEVLYVPGVAVDVRLRGGATTSSGTTLGGPAAPSAIASAFADPVFSFDQEAFDAIARDQGFATFDLSAFFAFEQSSFAAPVPEPSSMVLMLAGCLLVAVACRRRNHGVCLR